MRAEFFQAPYRSEPVVFYGPERRPAGYQDLTRQMTGEPALRQIYKRGARRMPVCPGCGMEVGPAEEHRDVTLGSNPMEGLLLAGMTVTYRYHERCEELSWAELMRRTVRVLNIVSNGGK